ncbi:MAG: hypothetical protein CME70_14870 [Halobacteriovorax sp.]|nr:hypothetical protein [Halobacteriovorax sp.]|tara:strand:+ start:156974 stop:159157 length:2184 start_codon:yes stop_codon:yes gene_type:complete
MVNRTPAKTLGIILLLFIQTALASEELSTREIFYNGQEEESHTLTSKLTEVRYRTETRDTTCYRQVPYQDTECEMVPEYDTVCQTIPGREDCRTEYDRQCRTETNYRRECDRTPDRQQCSNETRYRKECERGPSRRECRNVRRTRRECHMDNSNRQCRTEPAREQCRTNRNGERRCRTIPAREICENKPERVCRDVPYTEQECETVPGEVHCRKVPYQERVCHTIPGEQVCRQVPYNDEVCEDVPRQACEWIPSRQDCRTVQIGENQVCRDVTRYRQESYACQEEIQVPYTVTLKNFLLNSNLKFLKPEGYNPEFTLVNKLTENGESKFLLKDAGEFKPMAFLETIEERSENGKDIEIDGTYKFSILDGENFKRNLSKIDQVELSKEFLSFKLGMHAEVKGHKVFLKLKKDEKVLISRELKKSEYNTSVEGKVINFQVSMEKLALKLKNMQKYKYELVVRPIFKRTLAFPAAKVFSGKKEGTVYTYDSDDLTRLKDHLNQLSHLELSGEKLNFRFPNHDFISGARFSIEIGEVFNRSLTKDEFTWEIGSREVLVQVDLEKLGLELSALRNYSVTTKVHYVFSEEAPLPNDFSHTATINKELKPKLSIKAKRKLQEAASFLEEVHLKKYSLSFKLKKSEYLNDFKFHLHISKRSKVKVDKHFTKADVDVKENGEFLEVFVNFKKFGGKVTKIGKHQVVLKLEQKLHADLKPIDGIDLKKSISINLGAK